MSSFRRRLMMAQGGASIGIPSSEAFVGDICMYGVSEGKLIIVNDWDASKYPIDQYIPIGIVVVPGTHNVYGDGTCGVMSLNHMNCNTPTTGGSGGYMYWGSTSDIDTLENLNQVPYVGSSGNVGNTVIGVTDYACLPSDDSSFTAVTNPYDEGTNYYYYSNRYYISSPYMNDGSFNTNYSLTDSPSSTLNCLADFDGKGNTQKIIEVRGSRDYSSWTPSSQTASDYPAASCCDMYFTQGTKQGDWYLPAAGELGYLAVRMQTINDKITQLVEAGFTLCSTVLLSTYFTSSEHSNRYARTLDFRNGNCVPNDKGDLYRARAFLRV